ncbi:MULTISPECIES: hypothetical protein [unclassified Haladaptatus]|uniref:DUF7512 family protein n=1 Tax=unclassified Haladaptatus TaxID=2622732 RepID=UPI0023E8165D|nr:MULTISPECIES: hypothetical protein [unclassified Haladaptatus]
MIDLFALGSIALPIHAAKTVGIVLAEAGALYVGYGALATVVGPKMRATLEGEQ